MDSVDFALATAPSHFDDPTVAADYLAARERWLHPPALQRKGLWLLGSLALFALLGFGRGGSLTNLVILVAVLLFHELGHYVGMRAFGYRDVRMFFIPLVGAAASGRRGTVSQAREAIVLLLGPAPGIVVGLFVAIAALATHSLLLKSISAYLLGLNLLNLLPLFPLDGGRLASLLVFSRWAWSERLFVVLTALALLLYGVGDGAWGLAAIALFVLLAAPIRLRMSRVAARFRQQEPPLVNDAALLDDATARTIFLGVRATLPANARQPKAMAEWMAQVLEGASQRPPSLGISLALAAAWGTAFVWAVLGLLIGGAVR